MTDIKIPMPEESWVWTPVGDLTWGCRAILDERSARKPFLDILWDRQGWVGPRVEDRPHREKLGKMINSALPNFRAMVARRDIPGPAREGEVTIRKVVFKFKARGGYMWVAAGLKEVVK